MRIDLRMTIALGWDCKVRPALSRLTSVDRQPVRVRQQGAPGFDFCLIDKFNHQPSLHFASTTVPELDSR